MTLVVISESEQCYEKHPPEEIPDHDSLTFHSTRSGQVGRGLYFTGGEVLG